MYILFLSYIHVCTLPGVLISQTHNSEVGEFTSVYLQRLREAAE